MKTETFDVISLILDREYANKLDIPLIECFKPFERCSIATDSIWLPPNSDFGNLTLTLFNIVDRFDLVNLDLIKLYKEFYYFKDLREKGGCLIASNRSALQPYLTEQIIYWLKKTADELIAVIWTLKYYLKNDTYPIQVKVESIGSYLNSKDLSDELNQFNGFLKMLNNISNTYKHSLVNAQICAHRGEEEPLVLAYNLPYNNRRKNPDFYSVRFREVLESYKEFVDQCKLILNNYSKQLQERNNHP